MKIDKKNLIFFSIVVLFLIIIGVAIYLIIKRKPGSGSGSGTGTGSGTGLPPCPSTGAYNCRNNTCTCSTGNCDNKSGYCSSLNTEPLIIKCGDQSYNIVFSISDPKDKDLLVNNNGKDQEKGCWGINDPKFSKFIKPDHTACGITSITVPSDMIVSTYHCDFGTISWDKAFIVKSVNLLDTYQPNSENILDAFRGKIICGFKFEYVNT
jgi:hypothetical protein